MFQGMGRSKIFLIQQKFGQGCKVCKRIHLQGNYAIGIEIETEGEVHRLVTAVRPTITCCDEEKQFFETFETREEALTRKEEVLKHLHDHRCVGDLPVVVWPNHLPWFTETIN